MPRFTPILGPAYKTPSGSMYRGRAEDVLASDPLIERRGTVQLVFTSPPFPLNRKKRYGNLDGQAYIDWLASFAARLREYVTPDGSIVIELGNAWERGKPTMSTLPLEALLAFKRAGDLYLCQELICFNPARLPSPAQWVTKERSRLKDAFTRVWWLSPSEKPKADNRRVLTAYSKEMRKLLTRGTYNPGLRPSEHRIGDCTFLTDNGGAIPPNVLVPELESWLSESLEVLPFSNTTSVDPYLQFCRDRAIRPHPSRMSRRLVEFFVRFLTDEGDTVLDPFAGSNTTGFVAEMLKRSWLSIEVDRDFASASAARFNLAEQAN